MNLIGVRLIRSKRTKNGLVKRANKTSDSVMSRRQADSEHKISIEAAEIGRAICDPRYCRSIWRSVRVNFPQLMILSIFVGLMLYVGLPFFIFPHERIHGVDEENSVRPRQTSTLTDCGHPTRFRGWVDVQKQGVPNDYARYVGPTDKYPFVWLSIALAGSTEQHTDPGLYEERSGIVKRTPVKPRQKILDIDKLGLPDHFKGWVDVQNQGVPNDYAYYVGPTDDIPFSWLTVALAGSSQQRTCVGLYTEKYGVVRPTLGEMHSKQAAEISCEQWESMVRRYSLFSASHSPYRLDLFANYDQSAIQQMLFENGKNISNITASAVWRHVLRRDLSIFTPGLASTSIFKTMPVSLIAAMNALVTLSSAEIFGIFHTMVNRD